MNVYFINSPDVIADNFDGETVIVNLKSGKYFSIRGKSQQVFTPLSEGVSVAKIVAALVPPATVTKADMQADLLEFAEKLVMLDILKKGEANANDADLAPMDYEKLTIEVFNDMDEIIMVDPIKDLQY